MIHVAFRREKDAPLAVVAVPEGADVTAIIERVSREFGRDGTAEEKAESARRFDEVMRLRLVASGAAVEPPARAPRRPDAEELPLPEPDPFAAVVPEEPVAPEPPREPTLGDRVAALVSGKLGDSTSAEVARELAVDPPAVALVAMDLVSDGVLRWTSERKCRATGESTLAFARGSV